MSVKTMRKALLLLKQIPAGKVVSYKELARVCNTSPRAIGRIMARNKYPKEYLCYKVVSSSGELTGYSASGGLRQKEFLLRQEGIEICKGVISSKFFYYFLRKRSIL